MPVRLQINFFPSRFRGGRETLERIIIDKDGRTTKQTVDANGEGHTRTEIEDVGTCRQIDVLNRTERQSPINSPVYVCNLMQIFNWVRGTTDSKNETYSVERPKDDQENLYEIVENPVAIHEPIDFYAEMFDTGINEIYESRSGNENICRTLSNENRHILFPYFWQRGGTIVGISDQSILNFRRRVQRLKVTDNESAQTKMCTIDMLMSIDNQLGQQPDLIDPRDDFRRYELTLSTTVERTTLRPRNGHKGHLKISAFTDVQEDTPAAFLPWESMPFVQLRLRSDRLDGEASLVHRTRGYSCSASSIFWPRRTILRQAENFCGLVAELFYLTDDTAHKLRFGELCARIENNNYAFTKLIDRFAHDQLDAVLLKLIKNRSIVARVNEDCVTNKQNPRSITLYLTSVAGRIVHDRGENDTQNQVWNSMNQQNTIGGITYIGQLSTEEKQVTFFAAFACPKNSGERVRCIPYRPSAKRFYDKARVKLRKYDKFNQKIDTQIVAQLSHDQSAGKFAKFTMTGNTSHENRAVSYVDLDSRRIVDDKRPPCESETIVLEIVEKTEATRRRGKTEVMCLAMLDSPAENKLLRSTVQLTRCRLLGKRSCFIETVKKKRGLRQSEGDIAYFNKFAGAVESIVQLLSRTDGRDCDTLRNELCSNARQLRMTQRTFEQLIGTLSTVERGEEQFGVTKREIINSVQNMLRIIVDTSELLLKSGDHYSHRQLTILLDNVSR